MGWNGYNINKEFGQNCNDYEDFGLQTYHANLLVNEITKENLDSVKRLLIDKKANPNFLLPERDMSPMHLMAGLENEYFSVEVLHLALQDCHGDPNVRSQDGLTPVHLAAMWGRCKVLELLLNFGGDPDLVEYKASLNAEDLALREHQWHTYATLATFTIMSENDNLAHSEGYGCVFMKEKLSNGEVDVPSKSLKQPYLHDCNRPHSLNSLSNENVSTIIDGSPNSKDINTKATQANLSDVIKPTKQDLADRKLKENCEGTENRPSGLSDIKADSSCNTTTSSKISSFLRSVFMKSSFFKRISNKK